MRAIVYREYGAPDEVLELGDVDIPVFEEDEVLVRVHAAGLNPYDWHFMRGLPYVVRLVAGPRKPKSTRILGSDMAGRVEAVGSSVTRFQPADEVYGEVGFGGCADYVRFSGDMLGRKPANLSFEQAAAVPMAGVTALQGVRDKGKVQPGQKVLVNGASGGVGTFAVQLAKASGAEVTGVCGPRNVDMVRSIGADHVIDNTEQDFTEVQERYDLVLDTVGNHSISECRRVLAPSGTYGAFGAGGGKWFGPMVQQIKAAAMSPFVSQRMVPVNDRPNEDLGLPTELIEAGKVTPVIDRTYELSQTPAAVRYLETGHVRGKVVVTLAAAHA
jgi:NADPH:quinone reductase-like Zn-dependent oxidoreductase